MGNLFGLADADMPDGIDEFDAYMRGMLEGGDLLVMPEARDLGVEIVMQPPVPLRFRPLLELVNQITVGLLPATIRRGYGLAGIRRGTSRCTAARSTPSACSCRCCRRSCG